MSQYISVSQQDDSMVLSLPGEMTIDCAEATRLELLSALDSVSGELEIDASDLRHVDTSGAQLLAGLTFELQLKQIRYSWKPPTKPVLDTLAQLDLVRHVYLQTQS